MGAFGPPRLEERPILVAGVHFLARGGFNAIRAGEADSAATDASVPITVSVGVPTTLVWALLVAARLSGIPSIACTYASHLVAGPPATAVVHTIFLVAVRSQMPSVALTGPCDTPESACRDSCGPLATKGERAENFTKRKELDEKFAAYWIDIGDGQ